MNSTKKYHKTNYYDDPEKHKNAISKRRFTNLNKYGSFMSCKKEDHINRVNLGYARQKNILDITPIIFTENELHIILNTPKFFYKIFFGKSGNRKLLKLSPYVYKSLIYYTDKYEKYIKHNRIYFTCRLLIAAKYNFNLPKKIFCRCGKWLLFDRQTSNFFEKHCCKGENCYLGANSPEYFKYKYGERWEDFYKKLRQDHWNTETYKNIAKLRGRLSFEKRMKRPDTKFHTIGKNEKFLLDSQEIKDSCKIDRNFTVLGYYPDGYCHETNTIYEVYEKYHKSDKQKKYDIRRQYDITNHLNCKFVIIWDL